MMTRRPMRIPNEHVFAVITAGIKAILHSTSVGVPSVLRHFDNSGSEFLCPDLYLPAFFFYLSARLTRDLLWSYLACRTRLKKA